MGSEKPTQDDLDLIARFCQGYSFHFDNDRARIRRLLEAYKATQRPIEPDPEAPLDVADLPAFWDARRARLGKNASVCAAELRRALEQRAGGVTGENPVDKWYTRELSAAIARADNAEHALAAAEREREDAERGLNRRVQRMAELLAERNAATARATLLQSELDHALGKIEGMRAAAARAETAEGLLRAIERHASAIIQEGGDVMTLNYDAAKALAGKLDAARAHLQSLKGDR